jgi:hypothetical protein
VVISKTTTIALKEEWEVDPTLYPDFSAVADDLHSSAYHLHVYFNPFVYEGSKAWSETADQGWLVKREDGAPYTLHRAQNSPRPASSTSTTPTRARGPSARCARPWRSAPTAG